MTVRALPPWPRVAVVTVLAVLVSIAVNAGLVWLATAFDPSLQHYSHFRLSDYGTLTAVGVVGAGTAWYVVTRTLDPPRRAFFRTAVVVMLVLWVPDGWLLLKHEPTRGVVFLMIMHLAVALITYNLLVFAAPVTDRGAVYATVPVRSNRAVTSDGDASIPVARVVWLSLMIGVCVEFAAGLFGMLYVPFNRPDGWLSHRGEAIYVLHALLGGLLGVGALAVVLYVFTRAPGRRVDRIAAVSGLVGVVVGALGGILCVDHPLRLLGMALMFLGGSVAFFGYLIPMIDEAPTVAGDAS
jgi:small-conductance mechanosensitive channel